MLSNYTTVISIIKYLIVICNIMGSLKQLSQIAAVSRYFLLLMDGIFKRYYYITFTCSISCVTFLVLSK